MSEARRPPGIAETLVPPISVLRARLRQVPHTFERHGLSGATRIYADRLYERWQDWRMGIRTRGYIPAAELGLGQDSNEYEPVDYGCLRLVFELLPLRPGREVFLDYGCGLGRAVIAAARQPFRRVLGIELSPALAGQARRNLANALPRLRCRDVSILNEDAASFEVPEDVSVVFLFNPFTGAVLEQVRRRLRDSLARRFRDLRVVYLAPDSGQSAQADWPGFRLVAELALPRPLPEEGGQTLVLRLYEACVQEACGKDEQA